MSEPESTAAGPSTVAGTSRTDWLLTAFLVYFLIFAGIVVLLMLIAWNNGN